MVVVAVTVFVYLDQSFRNGELSLNIIPVKENPYVKEYALPHDSAPNGLVVDNAGLVWVTSKNSTLYSVDPTSGQVKNYAIKMASSGNVGTNSQWFGPLYKMVMVKSGSLLLVQHRFGGLIQQVILLNHTCLRLGRHFR